MKYISHIYFTKLKCKQICNIHRVRGLNGDYYLNFLSEIVSSSFPYYIAGRWCMGKNEILFKTPLSQNKYTPSLKYIVWES